MQVELRNLLSFLLSAWDRWSPFTNPVSPSDFIHLSHIRPPLLPGKEMDKSLAVLVIHLIVAVAAGSAPGR
ncbi:uncharacterized protein BO80DRAFT_428480 [Aspergillus ibericus CBS 121593]|uniref:Uncharacterized protein n=1 Tax=Aspergillus ibericus CBS 121593 TaxID=1448316 RepID=A0A395GNT4_9EURO|nr:hypothetical protein BO80DRAFT_428480 [Aspergillus ibericus CBS 121593]RAK97139.1 hypothetical protein BO80DRAFT_428480 [Aspergillus ibericus CBS 121593]